MKFCIALLLSANCLGQVPAYFDSCKINRLHNRSIFGDGVKIGIIGTGCNVNPRIKYLTRVDFTNTVAGDSMNHDTQMISAGADSVTGIAPNCHVYSLKIYNTNANTHATFQTLLNAIQYCIDSNITIATNSIAIGTYANLNDAMTTAWNAGVTLFMSAGNNPGLNVTAPAACDSVISVGARDETLGFINSYLSPHNKVQISGTNGIFPVGGTSQASSTFAFMTTLIKQRFPEFSPLQIKLALQRVAQPWVPPYNTTYTSPQGITLSALIGRYFNSWIY